MNHIAENPDDSQPFQMCGSCGERWKEWSDFILDPDIRLIGFQAIAGLPEANLMIFEHSCGSSISILAKRLRHIVSVSEDETAMPSLFGTAECNQYCRFIDNLEACDRPCANARDRQLILTLLNMKRSAR